MMSNLSKYEEQFNRVLRWYERYKEINNGILHTKESDNYQDDVFAFFMNCYHLKDWIKNDPSLTSKNLDVESFVSNNNDLSLCADICNSIKHLKLNSKRSNRNHNFGSRKFKFNLGNYFISPKYSVGNQDAFDLATKCVEAWKKYIKNI